MQGRTNACFCAHIGTELLAAPGRKLKLIRYANSSRTSLSSSLRRCRLSTILSLWLCSLLRRLLLLLLLLLLLILCSKPWCNTIILRYFEYLRIEPFALFRQGRPSAFGLQSRLHSAKHMHAANGRSPVHKAPVAWMGRLLPSPLLRAAPGP
jgi:hypothetical protein